MLALTISAELNGVTSLTPTDTQDAPFYYTFRVQCTSCRETHPNWVSVSRFEENEMSNSRGEANFVWRCKNCKREHSASIVGAARGYDGGGGEKKGGGREGAWGTVLEIDCRGLEFVEFRADGEWEAVSSLEGSKTKFTGIDLTEGEWYDYDEKAGEEVSIKEIKWELKRA